MFKEYGTTYSFNDLFSENSIEDIAIMLIKEVFTNGVRCNHRDEEAIKLLDQFVKAINDQKQAMVDLTGGRSSTR